MLETILRVEHLTKCFGNLTAVDDLSLDVCAGEIFGFLGPNGAGKTTSLLMICGLLKPDAGHVFINGKPVVGASADVRARVGVCPQEAILWEKLSCLEQLEYIGEMYALPRKLARQRGSELLGILGLGAKANVPAGKLSGGMKRRLNIVLALVHDPDIVILDEPEAGLDPQSRVLVRDYIRSLARRKTVILTTHNMDEVERLADRIAIIDRGRLLVLDTIRAIKQTVGEGDVLELKISGQISLAVQALAPLLLDVSSLEQTVIVRGHYLVERMPEILNTLRVANTSPAEVRLRTSTLEDVFIALTGRRLRE